MDNEDKPVTNKLIVWKQFIETLFEDERINILPKTGSITTDEVETAIKLKKEENVPGFDKIHAKFLQLMNDNEIRWMDKQYIQSRKRYQKNTKELSKIGTFTIRKRLSARRCE